MPGKCKFNTVWLGRTEWSSWLRTSQSGNVNYAHCAYCKKDFSISSMGESAITAHFKGKKHAELQGMASNNQLGFFSAFQASTTKTTSKDCVGINETVVGTISNETAAISSPAAASTSSMLPFVSETQKIKAEILWNLKMVQNNFSFKSNEQISTLFQEMFPDSTIAKQFQCSESKAKYLTVYGLGSYFLQFLRDQVKNEEFVLLFDESLNKKMQKKQMDIHLRFWNSNHTVQTRYYTSLFMGHATATDILGNIEEVLTKFKHTHLVQLSMDGPNVNWKVFNELCANLEQETGKKLLNVGSCGLHIVHGAFQTALSACDWDIGHILFSAYTLFKDTPARRDDFIAVTKTSIFPFKFVKHRWVENVPVLERFLSILPHLTQYVKSVRSKSAKNVCTKSFDVLAKACDDPTLEVKLHFVLSLAIQLQPFLKTYQDDKPLLPFLAPDLLALLKNVATRFIKEEVLVGASTCSHFLKLDLANATNHKGVVMGFSADRLLLNTVFRKKVTDKMIFVLKQDAKQIMIKLCTKLQEKSPVQYPLARNVACLDPLNISQQPSACITMMERLLRQLVDAKQVKEEACDTVLRNFSEFLQTVIKSEFDLFDKAADRLDTFLYEKVSKKYPTLWEVIKKVLLLSHGQASVERGFSINKEMIVENQKEDSLIARRIIKDHISSVGGVLNVNINKDMITYARSSRSKYMQYLAEQKDKKDREKASKKRKADEEAVSSLKEKRQRLQKDIDALYITVRDFADKCEHTGNVQFIVKSNALRRTAEEKEKELKKLDEEFNTKFAKI